MNKNKNKVENETELTEIYNKKWKVANNKKGISREGWYGYYNVYNKQTNEEVNGYLIESSLDTNIDQTTLNFMTKIRNKVGSDTFTEIYYVKYKIYHWFNSPYVKVLEYIMDKPAK